MNSVPPESRFNSSAFYVQTKPHLDWLHLEDHYIAMKDGVRYTEHLLSNTVSNQRAGHFLASLPLAPLTNSCRGTFLHN